MALLEVIPTRRTQASGRTKIQYVLNTINKAFGIALEDFGAKCRPVLFSTYAITTLFKKIEAPINYRRKRFVTYVRTVALRERYALLKKDA